MNFCIDLNKLIFFHKETYKSLARTEMLIKYSFKLGTFVTKVTATDADDPVYGNSAKLVYSILEGQPYFSIEPHTGR